jgi:dihydroorotase
MNRRHFLAATTAAGLSRVSSAAQGPAKYDLVLRGGRVIDPSRGFDAMADVGISRDRVAVITPGIRVIAAAETLDASGKLVVRGLIDIHTHATRAKDGPALCLADGITGLIDAGTQGADHIDDAVTIARTAPQPCRVLVNIGRHGVIPEGDTLDLSLADVALAKAAIDRNRDMVVGVKARLSREVAGENDYEVLRRAQEVASSFRLPVMIHMGQTISPLSRLLPLLKPGDIVTHLFAPPPNSIVDDDGRILPVVLDARRRGVIFDVGNGRTGHMRWDTIDRIVAANFLPDTVSTDWTPEGREEGVINLPNVMSKLLMLGMPLSRVVACATNNAARAFPVFRGHGTLKPGAQADLAVLELRDGSFEFLDNLNNKRTGKQRLFPVATLLAGKLSKRGG